MQATTDTNDPFAELAQMRRERDLYGQLLELGAHDELEPFLEQALALMVEMTGARRGYLEVQAEGDDAPRFSITRGCSADQIEGIRASFSRGVMAAAIMTGKTIVTASALTDPRFCNRGSVRLNSIEAVLCAPIGGPPPFGVLYLQEKRIAPVRKTSRAISPCSPIACSSGGVGATARTRPCHSGRSCARKGSSDAVRPSPKCSVR
jgi:hypothetical protein